MNLRECIEVSPSVKTFHAEDAEICMRETSPHVHKLNGILLLLGCLEKVFHCICLVETVLSFDPFQYIFR